MPADGWSEDRVLGGRLSLRQPIAGYRVAIDPILLAAAVEVRPGGRVLDLGAGVGAVALALACRRQDVCVVALERQRALARALAANVRANGLAPQVTPVLGDARQPPFARESFDAVATNPPFHDPRRVTAPATALGLDARVEGALDLASWLAAAARLVRPGGFVFAVHRADRLSEIATALQPFAGGLEVLPLWPRAGQPARRVLIRACVGRTRAGRLLPGLVLHAADGHFTAEAERVLRDGHALDWENR